MPLKKLYVVARNAGGRATLQHRLVDGTSSLTGCGHSIEGWSRHYMTQRIEEILCLKKGCRS